MPQSPRLWNGPDGRARCFWCQSADDYIAYHDTEWGYPVADDRRLFEKLSLESFQSGLSWLTILRKRNNFRRAFADFGIEKVARFTPTDVERLLQDAGIVRHRGKIESTINNAQQCCNLVDQFGSLSDFVWRYTPAPSTRPTTITWDVLRTMGHTPESKALSKDLKKRGWRFVGPTTVYAFMQAAGLVNDHMHGCAIRQIIENGGNDGQPARAMAGRAKPSGS
jgi:DNA-3-methyladenine glycosylase I